MAEAAPIVLWQVGPCWGLPSASPFCVKLETWLRMAKLPYEARVVTGLPRSSTGKVPWVELSDGRSIADSGRIIEVLGAEHGVDLDEGLDARGRALAVALTRMLEDHLYWAIVRDRWAVDSHWARTKAAYFGGLPIPLRWLVPPLARRGVRRALHGQGFGRMEPAEITSRIERDLDALVELLGEQEFCLGRPSSVDATAYAFLISALRPPFEGPLQQAMVRRRPLVAFCERMEQRWW